MSQPESIAHYRILCKLGEGGMGAVYRATDTKLNRDVAIKVLPDAFAQDAARMQRFTREAQVLAALNHPKIAAIYGIEERALVLELVDGEDLKGPLPLETALHYAHQIADALEAAHEKGIVHRDLKPANVKVTAQGVVKVLDFGLAKTAETSTSSSAADSPTLTIHATQAGVIMGTAGYMSPEQAAGKPVDKRSDIWAFGVVLCELLTGRRLFDGETVSHTLAAVLRDPIDLSTIPAPPPIRALLARCLDRDPKRRLRDIGEARVAIESYLANATPEPVAASPAETATLWKAAAVGLLAVALGAVWWSLWHSRKVVADHPLIQLDLDDGPNVPQDPAISPDGSRLVFVSGSADGSRLAMRRLDQPTITLLTGTEGARAPFFSPDGRSVGFFTRDRLKVLPLDGGAPTVLADASDPGGAAWGDDGSVVAVLHLFSDPFVYRVPALGGALQRWVPPETGDVEHVDPVLLPGGKGMIFTRRTSWPAYSYSLRLALPGKPESREILKDAQNPRYLNGGYLVFDRQGKIFAAPFDLDTKRVTGEAVPMVADVPSNPTKSQFDVSPTGVLVYRRGGIAGRIVVRIDPAGKQETLIAEASGYIAPRLSPDGKRLAIVDAADKSRILIHDLSRGVTRPLTLDDRPQSAPVWTPDGQQLVYRSGDETLLVRADGTGQPDVFSTDQSLWFTAFSRDGRLVAGTREASPGEWHVWVARADWTDGRLHIGKPVNLPGSAGETQPCFSPDGRFIAYMAIHTGAFHVFVASLTANGTPAGGQWQISAGVGYDGIWPAAGNRIFYLDDAQHIEAVSYSTKGESFTAEPPRVWSAVSLPSFPASKFDVMPDGKQVISVLAADFEKPDTHLRLILNFGDEVRRRLAGGPK